MAEPYWIKEDIIAAIHRRQLAEHGGAEGVRDEGLLQSTLARPRNAIANSNPKPDLAALAAVYGFGIAKNHPFVDGNKRVAAVVCATFVELNGFELTASDAEFYVTFLGLAEGNISEEELADWIREHLGRLS